MRGKAFLKQEECSCENLTLPPSSFFFSSLSLLCCHSYLFFKEEDSEQVKISQTNSQEVKNAPFKRLFCIYSLLFQLSSSLLLRQPCLECPWERLPLERIPLPPSVVRTSLVKDVPMTRGKTKARINRKDNKKMKECITRYKKLANITQKHNMKL